MRNHTIICMLITLITSAVFYKAFTTHILRAPLEDEYHVLTALCGGLAVGAFSLLLLVFSNKRLANAVAASTVLLQENERYLKAIQDSMQVGLLLIDSSTRTIVDVNQAALDISKRPRHEVVGRTCFACLFPAEERNCPILDGGQAIDRSERILLDGHGQEIPIMKSAVAIDISGKNYIIETFIDISERKKEQEYIVESEKRLRNFLESTSSAPWEFDRQNCRFTSMGEQIEKILGYPADSWQDFTTWHSRLHPEDQDWASEYFVSRIPQGQNHDFVYRAIHADGSCRWIRNVVSFVAGGNGPEQLLGFMQDITSQKEIELEKESLKSRLLQAHKMEAIGTLAGGIAHDFNNILGVILGFAGMANDDAPPESRLSKDLDRILVAGNRARDLVKQILAFSRDSEIVRMVLSPQPILKEALKMLRATLPSTITIKEDISSDCGRLLADPTQLHQILMNLGTNASHAMEESGGTLTIELKTADQLPPDFAVALKLLPADFVELTVSDTGCGIPPAIIGRIFDPFFTTKEIGKGTGMGLSILYGIVHDYGGTITVSSEPGKGSSFHLYFPKSRSEASSAAMDQQAIPPGKERILLVDDEALLCEMGRDMLERMGYTVSAQQCSNDALAEFSSHPHDFDLVITDQTMPGMTGLELSRRILQIRPDMPVILCTGFSTQVSDETAKANGIRDFVLKPVSKTMLAQVIRKVLDGSKNQRVRI
jgi:PAS domain S-box-containing protein